MNKFSRLFLFLITVILFSGCTLITKQFRNNQPESNQLENSNSSSQEKNLIQETNLKTQTEGKYVEYTPKIIEESANQGKKVVLFFHANWCPTCRAAEQDILSRINEIGDDIIIVKVDYDTYTDLKKKYNITYQHTFVQVDGDGNLITIWNGGDLDDINKNIKLSFCQPGFNGNENSC